jgi:hypothetical protein
MAGLGRFQVIREERALKSEDVWVCHGMPKTNTKCVNKIKKIEGF